MTRSAPVGVRLVPGALLPPGSETPSCCRADRAGRVLRRQASQLPFASLRAP
jgi:hypothetical protein